ncbi:MAG: hypothetical protein AAFR93_10215 [Pseudomonadota bacterium]
MADEETPKADEFGEINDVIASIRALVAAESGPDGEGDTPRKFNTLQLTSGDRLSEEEAKAALENARAIVAAQVRRETEADASAPLWVDTGAEDASPPLQPQETAVMAAPAARPAASSKASARFAPGTALNPKTPQTQVNAGRLPRSAPAPSLSVASAAAPSIDPVALRAVLRDVVREELPAALAKAMAATGAARPSRPLNVSTRKTRR